MRPTLHGCTSAIAGLCFGLCYGLLSLPTNATKNSTVPALVDKFGNELLLGLAASGLALYAASWGLNPARQQVRDGTQTSDLSKNIKARKAVFISIQNQLAGFGIFYGAALAGLYFRTISTPKVIVFASIGMYFLYKAKSTPHRLAQFKLDGTSRVLASKKSAEQEDEDEDEDNIFQISWAGLLVGSLIGAVLCLLPKDMVPIPEKWSVGLGLGTGAYCGALWRQLGTLLLLVLFISAAAGCLVGLYRLIRFS